MCPKRIGVEINHDLAIQSMHSAFGNLTIGLLFAAVFVYMLMVVNYQSFLDPLAVVLMR